MHDRMTTHDEFCLPDRNVISDRRVGACLGGNVYKKLSYRREAVTRPSRSEDTAHI